MVSQLPAINATLNALSAVFLLTGYVLIRRRQVLLHQVCMGMALLVSTLFLGSYLYYHSQVGSVKFTGQGAIRTLYFAILISHSILAAVIVPMVLRTLYLALKGRFLDHKQLARWTFPIWMYVSVTGVVIYEMLY